jgi:hypothetical protein
MTQALQPITATKIYGDRNDVREIANRLEALVVGGRALNVNERLALAQISIAHGLDPFNGECWFIPTKGTMIGIKGLRKLARKQLRREHGEASNFYCNFIEIVDEDQRKRWCIPEGALAFECRLFDTATIMQYAETYKMFNGTGMTNAQIVETIGVRPYTVGIGQYVKGESTKMTPIQVAYKRAESDAIKRRFDVELAGLEVSDGDDDVIEADVKVVAPLVESVENAVQREAEEKGFGNTDEQQARNRSAMRGNPDLTSDEPFGTASQPIDSAAAQVADLRDKLKSVRSNLTAFGGTPRPLTVDAVKAMTAKQLQAEIDATNAAIEALEKQAQPA